MLYAIQVLNNTYWYDPEWKISYEDEAGTKPLRPQFLVGEALDAYHKEVNKINEAFKKSKE